MRRRLLTMVVTAFLASATARAEDKLSPFTRITLGAEQTGASSAETTVRYLADFNLTGPLVSGTLGGLPHIPRLNAFGDFRFTSVTQSGGVAVTDFASGFSTSAGKVTLNNITQGLRFGVGAEFTFHIADGFGRFDLKDSEMHDTADSHIAPSVFVEYGATTPLSPLNRTSVYKFDSSVQTQILAMGNDAQTELQSLLTADPMKVKNVAFVTPDRDRFFHHVYVGLRLKTYDINNCLTSSNAKVATCEQQIVSTRGVIDAAWGFDEELTGGARSWKTFALTAFYRLPLTQLYVFGDVRMNHVPAHQRSPLILKAADSVNIPSDDTIIVSVPNANRDVWKLGVGVDLIPLVAKGLK